MNAPTALIAEDEPLIAAALRADLLQAWPGLQVLAQVGDGLSAVQQALALKPRLCFLDIRMPGLDGLQAAQALAEDWPDDGTPFPLIVFVTAYDQYALQAFEREAVDYLLKPVDAPRLAQCVQRLQRLLAQPAAPIALDHTLAQLRGLLGAAGMPGAAQPQPPRLEMIQAGVGSTLHLVPVDEVLYFEAADKYVRVVTADKEHLIRLSLRELLPQLDAQRFWQVHRSLVVQARCIATATREASGKVLLTLRGRPERLTASRLYAHLFKGM
ncbi:LytR/AlgR family response regulator transcription factor [Aquincola tertiaricarbonis]|uniref:LytR/AlgR family response regulator transcription factor n=1 Tax=Aquincola tertiaricarbonis TaxID=391953 RepID=UPI000614DCC1|nr:LytTR family DNA-binding domain-containing protein [Aquincola tertiaricarbonis]